MPLLNMNRPTITGTTSKRSAMIISQNWTLSLFIFISIHVFNIRTSTVVYGFSLNNPSSSNVNGVSSTRNGNEVSSNVNTPSKEDDATATDPIAAPALVYPFRKFSFAPNNVCTNPETFYCHRNKEINTNKNTSSSKETNTDKDNNNNPSDDEQQTLLLEFNMKNVPGNGDCMFLAVALATSTSMGLGGNDAFLNAVSKETRDVVAQVLSTPHGHLHVSGKQIVRVRDLLKSAANSEGVSMESYIELLRDGSLQGGGPELTVLSNVLRRPISIYELDDDISLNEPKNKNSDDEPSSRIIPSKCRIKCVGTFGDIFKDPCADLPNPALLSPGLLPGAYSWHIHVLVVDAGPGEKHACALLPKFCYVL